VITNPDAKKNTVPWCPVMTFLFLAIQNLIGRSSRDLAEGAVHRNLLAPETLLGTGKDLYGIRKILCIFYV